MAEASTRARLTCLTTVDPQASAGVVGAASQAAAAKAAGEAKVGKVRDKDGA